MARKNQNLKNTLNSLQPQEHLVNANAIPEPNTVNLEGHEAYELDDKLRLLGMLNTLKLQNQFYRKSWEAADELKVLINKLAVEDPYFVAQCIVYSRTLGEGMRTINNVAAAMLAPYVARQEWGKRFYSLWNRKTQSGGFVFRSDDMRECIDAFYLLTGKTATNAMKKGFADALQQLDTYQLLKYKNALRDVINIVHPNPERSNAEVLVSVGEEGNENVAVKTITAIKKEMSVSADTWEVANSEAGQDVSKAVKEGKISEEQAKEILTEAKAENWKELLNENKLGILAALRNLRSILNTNPDKTTIAKLCDLVSNKDIILKGKIMPYHLELANTIMCEEFDNPDSRKLSKALLKGYETAIPNLKDILKGRNLVIIDMSGSMCTNVIAQGTRAKYKHHTAMDKACLIGMTIAKAVDADVIRFGSDAEYVSYNPNQDVFTLAKSVQKDMECTNLANAFQLAVDKKRIYDRIFIFSDNECNSGWQKEAYKHYVSQTKANPYIYSCDLAAYGTTSLGGNMVRYYYGYGYSFLQDVSSCEFDPNHHIDKVRTVKI